jgi:hypothetical protein
MEESFFVFDKVKPLDMIVDINIERRVKIMKRLVQIGIFFFVFVIYVGSCFSDSLKNPVTVSDDNDLKTEQAFEGNIKDAVYAQLIMQGKGVNKDLSIFSITLEEYPDIKIVVPIAVLNKSGFQGGYLEGKRISVKCKKELNKKQEVEYVAFEINFKGSTPSYTEKPLIPETAAAVKIDIKPRLQQIIDSIKEKDKFAFAPEGLPAETMQLITSLKDKSSEVRWTSANKLGEIKDKRTVFPLITALKDDDPWVRRRATAALAKIGDVRAIEALIVMLNDEDSFTRSYASDALENMTGKSFGSDTKQWQKWWSKNKSK